MKKFELESGFLPVEELEKLSRTFVSDTDKREAVGVLLDRWENGELTPLDVVKYEAVGLLSSRARKALAEEIRKRKRAKLKLWFKPRYLLWRVRKLGRKILSYPRRVLLAVKRAYRFTKESLIRLWNKRPWKQRGPVVVAFLGRAGSGKSTAAQHLVENYGFTRVSFAGPLKELAKHLLDFSNDQVYGSQADKEAVDPRYDFTPRQFMQKLGNGARQNIHSNIWITACLEKIKAGGQARYVIDDCRYANEAKIISEATDIVGYVVKLSCPEAESAADADHPSEAEVDTVPRKHIFRNIHSHKTEGSIDLKKRIEWLADDIIK